MTGPVIPDLIEPIRALRFFLYAPRQRYLRSTNIVSVEWLPQETMIASCMRRVRNADGTYEWYPRVFGYEPTVPHYPLTSYCHPGCGFYSLKRYAPERVNPNVGLMLKLLNKRERPPSRYARMVFAEVEIWGRIVEHEWGYRSQYAKIIRVPEGQKLPKALLKRYQVKDE